MVPMQEKRFNKSKDYKVNNFCGTAKVKVSIFQRQGPKVGIAESK